MIKTQTRRHVLATFVTALSVLFSGCADVRSRELYIRDSTASGSTEEGYEITVEVAVNQRNGSQEWGTFHEVILIGYNRAGESLCQREIGNITAGYGNGTSVVLNCGNLPPLLTFRAREEPCDNTTIGLYQLQRRDGEIHHQLLRDKKCDEPELPTVTE
jgi:hypothetical protein